MGGFCPKLQSTNATFNISLKDRPMKRDNLSINDLNFWTELNSTNMIALNKITKNSIEFKHKSLDLENLLSFNQILDLLIREQNFFFLIPTIEITLCLIDFIEYIIKLKEKYGKDFFFLIDFSKFYLARDDSGRFSQLLYLDEKINDPFDLPKITINEDRAFFNSITGSFIEGSSKTLLTSLNKKSCEDLMNKTIDELDLNGFFYSYSHERYRSIQNKFSFEDLDVFYANCFIDFLNSVLFKKVFISVIKFDKAFHELKRIIRSTLSKKFIETQLGKINLRRLKVILTNFYLNNEEYLEFTKLIKTVLSPNLVDSISFSISNVIKLNLNQTDTDFILEKVKEYIQSKIGIKYGNCQYNTQAVSSHSCHFFGEQYSSKLPKDMCIQCMQQLMTQFFSIEENSKNYFYIKEIIDELKTTYPHVKVNFEDILQYYCIGMDNTINGELEINKRKVRIYKKNYIIFDLNDSNFNSPDIISYDDIVNLDIKAKKFYKFKKADSVKVKTSTNNGYRY